MSRRSWRGAECLTTRGDSSMMQRGRSPTTWTTLVWEHRAGLAFNQFDVGAGPNRQTRSQIAEHCRAQAQRYRARRAASFPPGMIEA